MRETLRSCSTHATHANGARTYSWALHSHHEQGVYGMSDELDQWFWIDT